MRYYKFFTHIFPVIMFATILLLEIFGPQSFTSTMSNENGIVEILQFSIIALAFIISALTLKQMDRKTDKLMTTWVGLATFGSLFIAGEEVSWGQHFLDWSTPEFWLEVNDQQETNLHNTSSWLDQKPRLLMEIGVLIGGLIIPLLLRYKPGVLPERFKVFYPDFSLIVITIIAIIIKILDKLDGINALNELAYLFHRPAEVTELFIYYFVLHYMLLIRPRIVKKS